MIRPGPRFSELLLTLAVLAGAAFASLLAIPPFDGGGQYPRWLILAAALFWPEALWSAVAAWGTSRLPQGRVMDGMQIALFATVVFPCWLHARGLIAGIRWSRTQSASMRTAVCAGVAVLAFGVGILVYQLVGNPDPHRAAVGGMELDSDQIVAKATSWVRKPASLGGGGGSFSGLTLEALGLESDSRSYPPTTTRLTVLNDRLVRIDLESEGLSMRTTFDAATSVVERTVTVRDAKTGEPRTRSMRTTDLRSRK